jgi:hypothetical protein
MATGSPATFRCLLLIALFVASLTSCNKAKIASNLLLERADPSVSGTSAYPLAIDLSLVGTYPANAKAGAGYFYDEVLEYRVWFNPPNGGDDKYAAFAQYEKALEFSKATPKAEQPLVLVRQREWIDEPEPSHYVAKSGERITEWDVKWLAEDKRGPNSIADFLKHPRPIKD